MPQRDGFNNAASQRYSRWQTHSKDVRDRAKQGCIQAAPKSLANALFIIQGHEVMTTLIVMLPFQVFVVEISWQLIL